MTEPLSVAPVVLIGGRPLEPEVNDALLSLRVERGLNVVGRATLRFEDTDFIMSSGQDFALNKKVIIKEYPAVELFQGTIVGVSLEQAPGEQPQLVITADDDAYKLTLGSKTKAHLEMTYTAVVQQVVQKAGLKPKVTGAAGGANKYLLQAGSDLAFVDNIAQRIGFVWWVDAGMFNFAKAGTSTGMAKVTLAEDLIEFSVRASALRPTDVTVSGWSTDNLQKVKGNVKKSAGLFTTPPQFVKPYIDKSKSIGESKTGSGAPSPANVGEAKLVAQAQFDESLTASVVARGRAECNGKIKPGCMLEVVNAGPAAGKYYITEVQHIYDASGFWTRFVAGPVRPASLVDTLGPPDLDPGFTMQGLVVGVVTNNTDIEKMGRVKVKYAGIPEDIESHWARVLSTSGGKDRGMVFLPEVDDEVLVGFEGNDVRRPVVLGALFSKKNKLPEATKILGVGGKVDYRRITSRLGHIIEFADGMTPMTQHVLIKLGTAQHQLRLGADECLLEMGMGKPITIKAGMAKFAITNAGDVQIEGANITIKALAQLNLEGAVVNVKGTAQVQVQGAMVQVKADGVGVVEAGGPLALKGLSVAVN